ncbi:hypothetical protein [Limobrevibacterium gyesilva]|uniref:Uncharacterized protein n=1 Tax=Limobrevibacterium gyesilva TaxID=2991712 RepID=A0AA42CFF6_9PROT|nr:hypothetical protein [Limobrevibacterium gyesilva]MCW3476554.1 hypothetical protein [Limobrevibacterium gyesilva]
MTVLSNNPSTGLGALSPVPAGAANGVALGVMPAGAVGARLYLPAGASVSFTVAAAPPAGAPASVFTASQAGTGPNWDEALAGGQMIYVTAVAGSPLYRWF